MKKALAGIAVVTTLLWVVWPYRSQLNAEPTAPGFKIYRAAWFDSAVEGDASPNIFTHSAARLNVFARKHGSPEWMFHITGWVFTHAGFPYAVVPSTDSGLIIYSSGRGLDHDSAPNLLDDYGHTVCQNINSHQWQLVDPNGPEDGPRVTITFCRMAQLTNGLYHLRHGTTNLANIRVKLWRGGPRHNQ